MQVGHQVESFTSKQYGKIALEKCSAERHVVPQSNPALAVATAAAVRAALVAAPFATMLSNRHTNLFARVTANNGDHKHRLSLGRQTALVLSIY